jgi:hypothetical protein
MVDGGEQGSGDGVFSGLTPKNQRRLYRILSKHLPEVITADRVIVQKTGYSSEICKTMQLDVLAHLATVAEEQHDFDEDQQASQLAKIEEHLRRAIVEHPEEVLRDRIGDVDTLWAEYQRDAFGLRDKGELHGAPRHQELETLRHRMDALMEAARKTKPEETTWEETLTAAAQMTEAADLASELADKLNECIGRARRITEENRRREEDERRRDREERGTKKRWRIGIAAAFVCAMLSAGGGYAARTALEDSSDAKQACSQSNVASAGLPADGREQDKQNDATSC